MWGQLVSIIMISIPFFRQSEWQCDNMLLGISSEKYLLCFAKNCESVVGYRCVPIWMEKVEDQRSSSGADHWQPAGLGEAALTPARALGCAGSCLAPRSYVWRPGLSWAAPPYPTFETGSAPACRGAHVKASPPEPASAPTRLSIGAFDFGQHISISSHIYQQLLLLARSYTDILRAT